MVVYQIPVRQKRRPFGFLHQLSLTTQLVVVTVIAYILFSVLLLFGVVGMQHIAIVPSAILQGKYLWTFITSMFMHGGFFHLLVNMLSLYFVGSLIERILGRQRYLFVYVASGIFASLLFVLFAYFGLENLNVFAVGASGALFGLIGLLIILTPNLSVYVMFIPIPIKMKYAAPGMLVLLWIISAAGNIPIGNIAHLGGLVFGLMYGLVLRSRFPNKVRYIQRHFR